MYTSKCKMNESSNFEKTTLLHCMLCCSVNAFVLFQNYKPLNVDIILFCQRQLDAWLFISTTAKAKPLS